MFVVAIGILACSRPPADAHGVVLHVGPATLIVQHDDLRNRVVPGVERYRSPGVTLQPGDGIDLYLDDGAIRSVRVTGTEPLPQDFVPGGHPLVGTVVNVDGIRVTVDHEAIPDLMPAMAMGFGLAPWEVEALAVGDRIRARLLRSDYGWLLADPEVIGHAEVALRTDVEPLQVGERLPRMELTGEDGKPLVVGEGQGVPTLLTFIYTRCPDPSFCPAIAARMAALQGRLREERIVTVTLDPEHDTPEVLAAWGEAVGADTRVWRLARAEPLQLQRLALYAGQHVTVEKGTISHLHRYLVLDRDGALLARFDTDDWPLEKVLAIFRGAPGAGSGAGADAPR